VSGGTAAPGAASVVERYRLRWEHPTEQAWIVDRIVEAIAGFAGEHWPAAPHGRATVATRGNPDAPEFAVSLPAGDPVQVPIRDYIWSPDAYAPIAAVVIAAGSTVSEDPPAIASSLEALTHPLAAVIQQENLRRWSSARWGCGKPPEISPIPARSCRGWRPTLRWPVTFARPVPSQVAPPRPAC
jgi:hypothetical protein